MPRTCLIIANPISGLGLGRRGAPRLEAALRQSGFETELLWTSGPGDAREAAAAADPAQVAAVLSVGGDGTLNEIVNGLGDKGIPVAIFPTGTGNVLAKEYDIPRSPRRVCQMLERRKTAMFDVGVMNGRRFLLFASAGFDAAVAKTMFERRTGRICMLNYAAPTVRALLRYAFPQVSVTVDGRDMGTATTVLVSNVHSYGGPFAFTPDADPTDGAFDICLFRGRGGWDVLRYFWGGITRRISRYGDVTRLRGRAVTLESDEKPPVQADGDYAGHAPASIELLPGRLPVIIP